MGQEAGTSIQSGSIDELARTVSQEDQLALIRSGGDQLRLHFQLGL